MNTIEKGVFENSNIYFHTPSSLSKELLYTVLCAGEFTCGEGYHVKRTAYNSYLIMFVKKGQGTVTYENKTYTVNENDIIFLNCYNPHEYQTHQGWEILWLHFDKSDSGSFFDLVFSRLGCVIPSQNSSVVYTQLKLIIEAFKTSKQINEVAISTYIYRMLCELIVLSSDTFSPTNDTKNKIIEAINFIESNFKNKIILSQIASSANLSVFHFSRQFKKETGYTPYEYVLKTRLDHAKMLLKKTMLQIKEIAFDCGFSSESNFVFTFHKNTGFSPRQFRNTPH